MRVLLQAMVGLAVLLPMAQAARAEYGRVPISTIDEALYRIDQARFLGARPDPALALRDASGRPATVGQFEGQPLILVMSYYRCDGSCPLVNQTLAELIGGQKRWRLGQDFTVLTVSFDASEDEKALRDFRQTLTIPEGADRGWHFVLAADSAAARRLGDSIGFNYSWSAQDRAFFHPGVYAFLSAEGRVVRYLYSNAATATDLELAISDAKSDQIRPTELVAYAISLCYSYNFKEGRYKLNLPLFAGMGSALFGGLLLALGIKSFHRRRRQALFSPLSQDSGPAGSAQFLGEAGTGLPRGEVR